MAFTRFKFKRDWRNSSDFPTVRHEETEVRQDMQALHDEAKDGLNYLMGELESADAAGLIGARGPDNARTDLQSELARLAKRIAEVTEVDFTALNASNIFLPGDTAAEYGVGHLTAPKVTDALKVLQPLVGKNLDKLDSLVAVVKDLGDLAKKVEELLRLAPASVYTDYWWRRRDDASKFEPTVSGDVKCTSYSSLTEQGAFVRQSRSNYSAVNAKIEYGTGVAQDASGELYLTGDKGSVTFTVAANNSTHNGNTIFESLKGKYVKTPAGFFIKVPSDANLHYRVNSSQAYFWATPVRYVTPNNPARAWSDVHDANANKYPASGFSAGMEYHRVGVPLDEARRRYAPAAGQYTGTGAYGSSFETTLNLWFDPALVVIYGEGDFMLIVNSPTGATCLKTSSSSYGLGYQTTVTIAQGRVSWHSTYSASAQGNTKGKTYKYLAFA